MILLQAKQRGRAAVVAGLSVVVLLLYAYRVSLVDDFFRTFPPSDFGYSSRAQITDQCAQSCINVVARGLIHRGLTLFSDARPAQLHLHLPFKAMQVLMEDQRAAIERNRLLDPRWVKGEVQFDGVLYPVRVRMKGALVDHWREPGRMSLRVDVRKGRTIMGFSTFALQRPESRQHPYEATFEELVRRVGGMGAQHAYVNLSVNGTRWGTWNMEERISREFLEKQQRKDSLLFDLSLQHYFAYKAEAGNPYVDPSYRLRDVELFADAYGKQRVRRNPVLRRQYSYVLSALLSRPDWEIYDWNRLTDSVALAFVWGTNHVLLGGNTRYYLNPYTLQLEPVTSDQAWPRPLNRGGLAYPYPLPYRSLVESGEFARHIVHSMARIRAGEPELDAVFQHYARIFPNDNHQPLHAVHDNFTYTNTQLVGLVQELHELLPVKRYTYVEDYPQAHPPDAGQIADLQYHVHARHASDGTLRVYNLLDLPLRLVEIRSDSGVIRDDLPVLAPKEEIVLNTGWVGLHDESIEVVTELQGHRVTQVTGLTVLPDAQLVNPLLQITPAGNLPAGLRKAAGRYEFQAGDWSIDAPLVLDAPLHMPAGTTLRFAPDAYLVVRGDLQARGSADAPIRFTGIDAAWKGVYVLEARRPSVWSHVSIENTRALESGVLYLTGGVTFYRSDLHASDVVLSASTAEDALNVVHSAVRLQNLRVLNARSDAIDLDFCTGGVVGLHLENIGGDGLDFSGSNILVKNLTAIEIHDKAVSVGEATRAELQDLDLENVGVGIASKDGSRVAGHSIAVRNARLAPAMSYRKKDFYGVPSMVLDGVLVSGDGEFVRQAGTIMTVNGKDVLARDLDVDALYRTGVMSR